MLPYIITAVLAAQLGSSVAARSEPEPERVCFTPAETREQILAHNLAEPFRALHSAARELDAQPIGLKLCRRRGELVYELSLLRHDGRVIRLSVNAKTGQVTGSKAER